MNAFEHNRGTEKKSHQEIVPLLMKLFNGRIVSTASGSLSVQLQKTAGDYLAQKAASNDFLSREFHSDLIGIELKTEEKHTGNLFIETWSNKSRWNPGWIYTSLADYLLYHFLDCGVCYVLSMRALKQFCFTTPNKSKSAGKLSDYREVEQGKHNQKNDTWGRLVPVDDLKAVDCLRVFWSQAEGFQFKF
jgi:hypothetical protein